MHLGKSHFKYANSGAMVHRRPVYIYLLNVPSFSSRYFNKIKRTSRLGRLLALSLEILSYLVEKAFYGLRPRDFELLNISPPLCQQATSIQCVKYGNTYTCKSLCWHTGGNDILKKCFRISIYLNVKLIVLPKILHH